MNLGEQLLGALSMYGVPFLGLVVLVASAGAPLPVSLLLIAAGSFADHGEMNVWWVIAGGTLAAIAGDQAGFAIGRWGGRRMAQRVSGFFGGEERLKAAEDHVRKWGGTGVFLTRWLFTPLGPVVNLVSGFSGYPWPRFLLWDAAGELLWVGLYVGLGEVFSHQVQALNSILGSIVWAILALGVAIFTAWKLAAFLHARQPDSIVGARRGRASA